MTFYVGDLRKSSIVEAEGGDDTKMDTETKEEVAA